MINKSGELYSRDTLLQQRGNETTVVQPIFNIAFNKMLKMTPMLYYRSREADEIKIGYG